jgi:hypothetical protein
LKKKINAHAYAGIHACRHTFLTEAGKHTDPFALQYGAGHDSIKTTMRYVHPQEDTVETLLFVWRRQGAVESLCPRRIGSRVCKKWVQKRVQSVVRFWTSLTNL